MDHSIKSVGHVKADGGGCRVQLFSEYIPALAGLEGFSHIQLVWWFSGCDNAAARAKLVQKHPYTKGPGSLGAFATRAPERPNPIALSCAQVTGVEREKGVIHLAYIDAEDGSPVLDIKPYTPSLDRVEEPAVPDWCAHWPKNTETSGDFDWAAEFDF